MSETKDEAEQSAAATARPQQETLSAYQSQVPFSITPAHVLAAASIPLGIGTYIGFKRQLKIVEKEARAAHLEEEISVALTRESKSVARRALGLGTMLSVSSFGLFGAVAFYASGFRSFDQAVTYLHKWGPRKRSQLENFLGIDSKRYDGNEDVQATRNMTSDEELDYYRDKYFSENEQQEGAPRASSDK